MGQMAVRLAKELGVQLLNERIVVGFADSLGFILGINRFGAQRFDIDPAAVRSV
ncbi:hypothetical protein D3C85_1824130 [compost metagenome]